MVTRRKNLYLWTLYVGVNDGQLLSSIASFEGKFLVSNNIWKVFCRPNGFYTMAVYTEACVESSFLAFMG